MIVELQKKINDALKCDLLGDIEFSQSEVEQLVAITASLFRKSLVSWSGTLTSTESAIVLITIVNVIKQLRDYDEDGFWPFILKTIFGNSYPADDAKLRSKACDFIGSAFNNAKRKLYRTYSDKNTYFSTIRAHSYSPVSSYEALLDILWEMFENNLGGVYIKGDSDFGRIANALSGYFGNPNILDDDSKGFELSGRRYAIKSGIKYLAVQEKDFLERIIDKSIKRISDALDSTPPKEGSYDGKLFWKWYEKKIASLGGAPRVRRIHTEHMAKDYKQILPKYMLDDNFIPVIHFNPIRLNDNLFDTPKLYINVNGRDLPPRDLDTAGNGILMNIKSFNIKLADLITADDATINITIRIIHAEEEIYNSEKSESLFREGILFRNDTRKELNRYEVEPGNYTLFLAPKVQKNTSNIEEFENHPTFCLWRLYGEEGESLQFGGRSIYFTLGGAETHIWLNSSNIASAKFMERGIEYDVYDKINELNFLLDSEKPISLGVKIDGNFYKLSQLIFQKGDKSSLIIGDRIDKSRQVHNIQIFTLADNVQLYYKDFTFIQGLKIKYDREFYWDEESSGFVNIFAQGRMPETISFDSNTDQVEYRYGNGVLVLKIPRIKWRINEDEWQTGLRQKTYWYEEFKDNSTVIEFDKPEEFTAEMYLDILPIQINKGKYMLGETLFSQEVISQKKTFVLWFKLNGVMLKLFEVATKPFFEHSPTLIKIDNVLYWRCDEVFVGRKNSTFSIILKNKRGTVLNKTIFSLNTKLLNDDSLPDGVYQLEVGIKKNAFSPEVEIIHEQEKIFGEYEKVRFNDVCFNITEVINTVGATIEIRPVVIENIQFDREENGFCFYKGTLTTRKKTGEKVYLNSMQRIGEWIKVNPVMLELKDSTTFWLTFYDAEEGAWIDFTIDKENSMLSVNNGNPRFYEGIDICKYKKVDSFEKAQFVTPILTRSDTPISVPPKIRTSTFINRDITLRMPIENLRLSFETLNALRCAGIKTVGDLKGYGKLQEFGRVVREEIAKALAQFNIS